MTLDDASREQLREEGLRARSGIDSLRLEAPKHATSTQNVSRSAINQVPDEFEALTVAYADAVLAKDPGRLAALYDADVRVFDAWERWTYDDLAAWRPSLDEWLGSLGDESVQVSFGDVCATARGEMGLLTAIVTYAAVDRAGAMRRSLQERLTWVLARNEERWAIAHQHTSTPVGFADQRAILRRD